MIRICNQNHVGLDEINDRIIVRSKAADSTIRPLLVAAPIRSETVHSPGETRTEITLEFDIYRRAGSTVGLDCSVRTKWNRHAAALHPCRILLPVNPPRAGL